MTTSKLKLVAATAAVSVAATLGLEHVITGTAPSDVEVVYRHCVDRATNQVDLIDCKIERKRFGP